MTTQKATRLPVRLAAIGTIAVAATSILAIPAANGASAKWKTISGSNVKTTAETPSIAKFGSTYEAVWVAATGSTSAIQARLLNAAGKPVGGVITALSGWDGMAGDPTILDNGSQRIIAFSGSITSKPAYDGAAEYYLTSTDGKKWTLNSGSLSAADHADEDDGTAVINDGGTIITALTVGGAVAYHVGVSSSNPAPGSDPTATTTGSGTQLPGLAADTKTHQVWAVWWSDSGVFGSKTLGVHAQEIYPTKGTMLNAPDSTNKLYGSFGGLQDASVAARVGGGVYTAYVTPNVHTVVLWKLGAKKPTVKIHDASGASTVDVVAAPHGRLWLYWRNDSGWRATRSNKKATKFGPTMSFPGPKNGIVDLHTAAAGVAGPLEAIATITNAKSANVIIARQFLARLTVKASPHAVKRGHTLTVKVTDVGDPVKGATVHFDGIKKKTNKKGKAKFKVPGSASLGKHSVTFSMSGYAAASTKITVVG